MGPMLLLLLLLSFMLSHGFSCSCTLFVLLRIETQESWYPVLVRPWLEKIRCTSPHPAMANFHPKAVQLPSFRPSNYTQNTKACLKRRNRSHKHGGKHDEENALIPDSHTVHTDTKIEKNRPANSTQKDMSFTSFSNLLDDIGHCCWTTAA